MSTTAREALIAEMLGDIDKLLARCEALQDRMQTDAATLDAAGERFRQATIAFTEQAKDRVADYLARKAAEAGERLEQGQREQIERALLAVALAARADTPTPARRWQRLAELAAAGLLGGLVAATLVWALLR